MAEGNGKNRNRALEKGLAVLEALNTGALLDWRSLEEVAAAASVTRNEAYGALVVLAERGWVEKSPRGWRTSGQGLIKFAVAAQEALAAEARRLGLK